MSGPHETRADLAGLSACIARSVECLLRVQEAMCCAEELGRKTRVRLGRWRTFLQATASPSPSPADAFMMVAALGRPHRTPRHSRHRRHAVMGLAPVLIIDDDEAMRAMLRLALEEGYPVWEAREGRTGLQLLRSAPARVVALLDLVMPVLTEWDRLFGADPIGLLRRFGVGVLWKPFTPSVLLDTAARAGLCLAGVRLRKGGLTPIRAALIRWEQHTAVGCSSAAWTPRVRLSSSSACSACSASWVHGMQSTRAGRLARSQHTRRHPDASTHRDARHPGR